MAIFLTSMRKATTTKINISCSSRGKSTEQERRSCFYGAGRGSEFLDLIARRHLNASNVHINIVLEAGLHTAINNTVHRRDACLIQG